jgi:hypothetical protein
MDESSMNSSMSSVTMFTDFDQNSISTIASDSFLRAPGGRHQMSMAGNNRMCFQAQHDHMPMAPRRSPHRDVYTEKEDQRPVMPKRYLSNRTLLCSIDDDVDDEDSKTVSSHESKEERKNAFRLDQTLGQKDQYDVMDAHAYDSREEGTSRPEGIADVYRQISSISHIGAHARALASEAEELLMLFDGVSRTKKILDPMDMQPMSVTRQGNCRTYISAMA